MSIDEQRHGEDLLRVSRASNALWFDLTTGRVDAETTGWKLLEMATSTAKDAARLLDAPLDASICCFCGGVSSVEIGGPCHHCKRETGNGKAQ